ncbi:MAG: aminomethyl-transferring glycine dehydrogenase subunit GcvPA [Oscillospiraceae bacterium]
MGSYIPVTGPQQQEMLEAAGLGTVRQMYADIPEEMLCGALNLPKGKSELEVRRAVEGMAAQNKVFQTLFRGAGAYRHYIPSVVKEVAGKETFVTAYTPYQAEISQGVLQAIFEFQTEISALTGLEVANASVYDGACAAAEATIMCRERARQRVLVAETAHPDARAVIQTYCESGNAPVEVLPQKGGLLNLDALEKALGPGVACLYLQSPNFYGLLEEVEEAVRLCHAAGVKVILGTNPIALALFKTPGELGADIAVGEGQPLGLPLSFGGPYLGYMACTKALMRRLPGRIAGQTTDADGKRAFVLTLQAREQHIRREKALSSICSNQALCALTATVYLAAMGPGGLRQAAAQCYAKAHYAAGALAKAGFARVHRGEFFHEFATACPVPAAKLMKALEAENMLGGLPVEKGILWCFTEMNTKQEIDKLAEVCGKVVAEA